MLSGVLTLVFCTSVSIAQTSNSPATKNSSLRLAAAPAQPAKETPVSEKTTMRTTEQKVGGSAYREVSGFFNVREANANVTQGEWEFEVPAIWETDVDGDDDEYVGASLKYGFSDQTFLELELIPVRLGDGGDHGAGDLALQLFHNFFQEEGNHPAIGAWIEGRFPTGEGSSGIDGELGASITKTLADRWRAHLAGFVETANGAPGGEDENGRRDFQWGAGVGLDYQCSDRTIGLINYFNKAAEENGNSNLNILEIGFAHELCEGQHLKGALDIGLDGHEHNPDFGAKLQWSIEFGG